MTDLPRGYDSNAGNIKTYIEKEGINPNLKKPIDNIVSILVLILQICTVAGIIATGIRYMYSSSDAKSQIKKTIPFLIAGIVIIFAGPTVIQFIIDVFSDITGT